MASKNFYSFKDIVIGSRSEYLKTQQYLNMLRDVTNWDSSKIEDVYYELETGNTRGHKTTDISCKIIERLSTLEKLLAKNEKYDYLKQPESGIITRSNCDDFYILSEKHEPSIINNDEFAKLYYYLLNSDFIKKIKFGSIEGENTFTNIFANNIVLQERILNLYAKMDYKAKDDIIEVSSSKFAIDENLISTLLNTRIPNNRLSNYHKKIIDRSYSTIKPVKIDTTYEDTSIVRLSIEEDNDSITLRKVL